MVEVTYWSVPIISTSERVEADIDAEFRLGISMSNTTAIYLHTMLTSVPNIQRDEGARDHVF